MSQNETIKTPQDYVNYTFNIEARGVAEVSSELMGLSNTVGNILGQLAFKTSEFLNHADMLAIGTGAAISALFTSATQDAIHFQQQVANVQAIGGESINASNIGDAAIEYSNKFGMATASMTEGLEALARAGITTTQVMSGVLEEGVKLSKLEGMDLEDSINDLIATTNLLALDDVNMNDLQYANMVREMNQHIVSTSESAPINAQNIIQTLQHVGGYASASGMDQDDLFAVIAQLGSRGTKGEMAGTALRAFIAAGQKDTAQRALARIGLNVRDLWSESGETMLPISEMKQVLDDALESRGYSKQEKLEFYSDFAGYKQANQIMKIDTSEVEHYKEKIANAWDLGQKLDTILGTVRGNLDRIYQTTTNFMQKVGSKMLPILNAFLVPLRTALTVFTKIPFMDTAFAATALFITFRTGLILFNKLVPAIAGFMSGISDSTNETRGLRTEWTKTREEIEQAKNIIDLIRNRDQEGLAKTHYETHGLSAANKAMAENTVAGQMYMGSDWYQEHGRIPWRSLGPGLQDMIIERFKPTQEFKTNYNEYVNRSRETVNEIVSEPIIIAEWENEDTLEAINVYVQEIFNLLNSDRTQGTTENTESNRERNRKAQYVKNIMDNNPIYADNYGHYGFNEYFLDVEKGFNRLTRRIEKTYNSLQKKLESFDNASAADMDRAQRKVYKKALFREAMTPEGRQYAEQANKSDVVLALERGQFNDTGEWYRGITDAQIRAMANAVNIDLGDFNSQIEDNRQEYIERIHNALNAEATTLEERQRKIQQITDETTAIWQRDISASDRVAIDPSKILENNANIARDIVRELSIHTTQGQSDVDAIKTFFLNEANRNNEELVNKATNIMFTHLKQAGELTSLEQDEVKYVIENLQRLQNTLDYFNANNIHTEFKDEMSGIKEIMAVNTNLFRVGGKKLGEAIEKGFVEEGLGRHSPGYLYHAVEDELDDIETLLKTRVPNVFNQASTTLKSPSKTFASKGETLGQAIDYILEDIDIIDYSDFSNAKLLDKGQQDTQLLKTIKDGESSYANFIYPFGTDISNFDRYGSAFPINNMKHLFDFKHGKLSSDVPDSIYDHFVLDNDEASAYLDALISYWTTIHTVRENGVDMPYTLGWTLEGFWNHSDMKLPEYRFNYFNNLIEELYRSFIRDSAQAVNAAIAQSKGFKDPGLLYRIGRMPEVIQPFDSAHSVGVFRGTTSLSADRDFLNDLHFNKSERRKMVILTQPGVKNITANYDDDYLSEQQGFRWEKETTIGNKQMFITYNPPGISSEYKNQRLVLLTPDQTEYMNSIIGNDEYYRGNTFKSRGEEPFTEAKSKVFDSGIQHLKRDSDTIQEILSDFDPDLYDDDDAYRDDTRVYQSEYQKGHYDMYPLQYKQRHALDIFAAWYGFDVGQFERFGEAYKDTHGFEAIIGATLSAVGDGFDARAMYGAGFTDKMIAAYKDAMYDAWNNSMDWDEFTEIGHEAFIRDGILSESDFDSMSDIIANGFIETVRDISSEIQDMIRNSPGAAESFYVDRGGRPIPVNSEGLGELFGSTSTSFNYDLAQEYALRVPYHNMPMEIYVPEDTKGLYLDSNLTGNRGLDGLWENQQEWLMGSGQAVIQFNPMDVTDTDFSNQNNIYAPYRYLALTPDQMAAVRAEADDILEDSLKSVGEGFVEALLNENSNAYVNMHPKHQYMTPGNMEDRVEDLLLFGRIGVGSKGYGHGILGEASHDKAFINPGVIKFHSDMYDDEYNTGYGQLLLENVVHELSHTLLNHQGRMDPHTDIEPFLRMDNFKTDQLILGYDSDFAAEFEANYVAYHVMSKLGLETSEKAKQRMNRFKQLIDDRGLSGSYNLELADSLVDTLVYENAEALAQIVQFLAPQFDMVKADTSTAQVAEEIRPVITALQSQVQNVSVPPKYKMWKRDTALQMVDDMVLDIYSLNADDMLNAISRKYALAAHELGYSPAVPYGYAAERATPENIRDYINNYMYPDFHSRIYRYDPDYMLKQRELQDGSLGIKGRIGFETFRKYNPDKSTLTYVTEDEALAYKALLMAQSTRMKGYADFGIYGYTTPGLDFKSGIYTKHVVQLLDDLFKRSPGAFTDMKVYHGGELNTNKYGFGVHNFRSLTWKKSVAEDHTTDERYTQTVYIPKGTPVLVPSTQLMDHWWAREEEVTSGLGQIYYEMYRNEDTREAEVLYLGPEQIHALLHPESFKSQGEMSRESLDAEIQQTQKEIEQKQKKLNELENLKKRLFASDDITGVILESWTNMKAATSGRLLLDDFYNHIEQEYNTETRNQAQEWIENAAKNVPKLLIYKNTALSKNKELLPDVIENWNDKRKQIGDIENVVLPDSGKVFQLPVHQEFIDNKGKRSEKGVAAKYIHKHSARDARDFQGIVDILDTDEVRSLSKIDQAALHRHIYEGSNLGFTLKQLMASDDKLGEGWGVINPTTAMDCVGRMTDGSCEFCDACYAFGQAVRLPDLAIKQIGKSLLFADLSVQDFVEKITELKMQVVRINQEGDFRDLDDYLKTLQIAALSPATQFYSYTKNQEVLDYINSGKHLDYYLQYNPEARDYIQENGRLPNYQTNNSLNTWEKGNYVAAPLSEIADYLEKEYVLCTGACEDCKQCLTNMNKVTVLRDGTNKVTINGKQETVSVADWADKTREEQIEFFSQFRETEEKTLKSQGEAFRLNAKSFQFLMDTAAAGDIESIALLNQLVKEGVIKKVGNATAYQKTQEQKLTGYQFEDTILYLSKIYKKKNNITDNVSSATKMLNKEQLNRLKRNSVSFIEGNTRAEEFKRVREQWDEERRILEEKHKTHKQRITDEREALELNKQYAQEASKYAHIRGVGVQNANNTYSHPYEASYQYGRNAYTDFMNDYLEQGDYLFMNKWDKARHSINESGKHKWMLGIFNAAEKMENGFSAKAQTFQETSRKYAQDVGDENLTKVKNIMDNVANSTSEFKNELSDLAEVFPVLMPLVVGLNAALHIEEQALAGVNGILNILQFAQGEETNSALLNTIGKMSESNSPVVAAIGDAISGAIFRAAGMIESALGFIIELGVGPILLIAGAIAAVIAAIKLVQFWEHKHAESLQESQKALEEATAKNNVALSQYQDLKKARESETDAIKKQQKARKEAIALYELEATRIEQRKAIHEEAALRNDSIWGEYGLRAKLQKMGLGFIAGGDFESQYENYDGTTKNIRQIKEASLGKLFGGSAEQRYVSSVYDKNSMFFAEVEAYKEPLQELYDKESKLIEKYGSIDIARGTKEFEDAVQEFADATGLNGETAGMMLDWLETENRVNQAARIGQAEIGIIRARADAAVMGVDAEGAYGLGDMNNLGDAMIIAQFQEMMNTAKTEVWWELLYAYLDTFISILIPWKWGEVSGNLKKVGIRQNELSELDAQGNKILQDMLDNEAERTDYGTGAYSVMNADTPFGAALEASAYNQSGVLTELSTIRRKDSTTPAQKEMLYYQRKISRDTEEIVREKERTSWKERAARAAAHGIGAAAAHGAWSRPIGAKGAAKRGTQTAAHLLNPEEVPMPGSSIWKRLTGSKQGTKLLGKGDDIIEMVLKDGKYVAKESVEAGAKAGAKTGAKTLGKTLAKAAPLLGPLVTAGFSIAEHNPFEKHYNEDGSEKKAFQSTGEVAGEVAGSVVAMGLGLAATAVGGPLVGAAVEIGASLILEPLGKAIGGVLGWLGDTLINGLAGAASAVWDGLTNAAGGVWDTVSGTAHGVWDWVTGGITNTANGIVNWLTGNEQHSNDIYNNVTTDNQAPQVVPSGNGGTTIIIKNININTEDDPEKIKDAFMNLMIEMQEQISPRQVSRTIGEPSSASISTTDANNNNNNPNNNPQVEGQNTNGNNPNPTN